MKAVLKSSIVLSSLLIGTITDTQHFKLQPSLIRDLVKIYLEGGGGLEIGAGHVLGGGGGASVKVFTLDKSEMNMTYFASYTSLKAASTPPCLSMKS